MQSPVTCRNKWVFFSLSLQSKQIGVALQRTLILFCRQESEFRQLIRTIYPMLTTLEHAHG